MRSSFFGTFDFGDGLGPVPAHRHINPPPTMPGVKLLRGDPLGGWVADTAQVHSRAFIASTACVGGQAKVSSGCVVRGTARVFGRAVVSCHSTVSGNASVSGRAVVTGKSHVNGNAVVTGYAKITGRSHVFGDSYVAGDVQVYSIASVNNQRFFGREHVTGACPDGKPHASEVSRA